MANQARPANHARHGFSASIGRLPDRRDAQVLAAMLMVADGRAPSVIVSNLAGGADVVRRLAERAAELGVAIELLERSDGRGHDVRVHARQGGGWLPA